MSFRILLTVFSVLLLSTPSVGQIVFEDHFDNCTIDDAWSVMQYEWTATGNGMLLGLGSAPQIGAGSPAHQNYTISLRWYPQSGQDLYVIINSTWDPETGEWDPADPGHSLLLWFQASGTMIIADRVSFGESLNYPFPISNNYGPWSGNWLQVSFGVQGGQIVASVVMEDRGEIAFGTAPVRQGVTSLGGYWNIEAQGCYFTLVDDVVVTGEGPVAVEEGSLGSVKSLFR